MAILTPGYNLGLSQTQLKQDLGGQGGQVIPAYLPDTSKFTGVAGTEYAMEGGYNTAPNLRYVSQPIFKQYKDASGNTFELVPSSNPAGLSDPGTFLRQISGAPQGYAQTPQELLGSFKNFTPLGTGNIFENVAKNEPLNIQPGETAEQYYKRTGVGYSPAFGQPLPAPITTPNASSQGTNIVPASDNVPNASVNNSQYAGPSIVDYLNSIGKPSDFNSRAQLAAQQGIQNYTGMAQQNTQLLNQLRGQQAPASALFAPAAPASNFNPPAPSAGAPPAVPSSITESTFQDQVQNILKQYGITPNAPTQSPLTSYADYYKQFLTQIGQPDIKSQFDATQKKYADLQNELQDKIAAVNDNPFISEGLRSAKITKLQTLYEAKTNVLTNQLKLYESQLNRADENARFIAGQALQYTHQNAQLNEQAVSKAIEIASKELDIKRAAIKDEQQTVNNLIQNYPDANISPRDSLVVASQKASQSQSFQNKNVMVRAVVDPVNGGVTYYYSKGGAEAKPGTIIGGGNVVPSPGQPGQVRVPPIIAASLEKAGDFQYIDMSKLAPGQIPLAQRTSVANNIPLLSKGDADKVQESNQAYLSASSLIQKVRDLTKNVITASNDRFSMGRQAFELNYTEQFPVLSTNNSAKEFIAARKSLLSLITRASGERGVLTDNDVNRIAQALPSYGDNKELGIAKANNLNEVIKSVFQGAIGAYIGNVQTGGSNTGAGTGNLQNLRAKYGY